MDGKSSAERLKLVLCRGCANFMGRRAGKERRRDAPRLCAAGMQLDAALNHCDSWVPVAVLGRGRKGPGHNTRA